MVEVAFFAKLCKMSIEQTLLRLKAAGVDSLPGGGAEISPTAFATSSATTRSTAASGW